MGKKKRPDDSVPPPDGGFAPEGEFGGPPDAGDEVAPAILSTAKTDLPGVDAAKKPKFGSVRPAGTGTVPRVCDQLERVGPNAAARRYKVACRNYAPQKTRYIIADSEADAVACYLRANALDALIARLKKQAGKDRADEVEPPELVVTELED